jgi:hypothetical protein
LELILVRDREAEVESLGPEIGSLETRRRLGRANVLSEQGTRANQGWVHDRIDLIARPNHIAPIQERVAHVGTQVVVELVTDTKAYFGNDRELIALGTADVARDGKKA